MSEGIGRSVNINLSKGKLEGINKDLVEKIFSQKFLSALGIDKERLTGVVVGYALEDSVVLLMVDVDGGEYLALASRGEAVENIVRALREVA